MSGQPARVAAAVVTFNRRELLRQCLSSLRQQTHRLDRIVVVDNGSQDGTEAMVRSDFPEVEYRNTHANLGSAAGFRLAIEGALSGPCDWIWIMDDDARPDEDCLAKLVVAGAAEGVSVACPAIISGLNGEFQLWHHKRIAHPGFRERPAATEPPPGGAVVDLDANAFVGPLVRRKAAEKVAPPNASFFMWGEDTDYTYRLGRAGRVILVGGAVIRHYDENRPADGVNWKSYYGIRNHVWTVAAQEGIAGALFHLGRLLFLTVPSIVLRADYKAVRLRVIAKATAHGLRGDFSRNDPVWVRGVVAGKRG